MVTFFVVLDGDPCYGLGWGYRYMDDNGDGYFLGWNTTYWER